MDMGRGEEYDEAYNYVCRCEYVAWEIGDIERGWGDGVEGKSREY
jgi:hypothetical protein